MAEAHTDEYLARTMTAQEKRELSDDEKRERKLAKQRISNRKYKDENPEKYTEKNKESGKKYREQNPEKVKQYREENKEKIKELQLRWDRSSAGKKSNNISNWKNNYGLQETPEEMDRIYELRETQELCSSCDVKLTRTGKRISTDACLDHSHETNRFRQICCKKCNDHDSWKKYWIDGIYGGTKVPLAAP